MPQMSPLGGRKSRRIRRGTGLAGAAGLMCCAALSLAGTGVASAASCEPLGDAWQYGLFTTGGANLGDSSSAGPVAVGGNATLTSFSVDTSAAPSGGMPALVVGGTLTTVNGGTADGTVFVGSPPIVEDNGGFDFTTPLLTANPVDFTSERSGLQSVSNGLSAQPATSGTSITAPTAGNGETLTLVGSAGASLDVFDLTGSAADAELASANEITITGTDPDATVVVNTDVATFDGTAHLMSTMTGNSAAADHVVWNFPDATMIDVGNSGWYGTILAPMSTVLSAKFDQFDGGVLTTGDLGTANQPFSGSQMGDLFAGCLPESGPPPVVPEGTPLALGGLALLAVGGALVLGRRRNLARPRV